MEDTLLETLYQKRAAVICRYLMKSGCRPEDAEDIVQESFCKAVECMAELSADNISAWIFRVAVNRWYDQCRREKRRPEVHIDEAEFSRHLQEEEDAECLTLKKEESEAVKAALLTLTEVQKSLLLLKYDLNLSYESIGTMLDMKPTTVKTYLYRARGAFQREWQKQKESEMGDHK